MQLNDMGIILSVRRYGDYAGIVSCFTRHEGLVRGMARHAKSSKQRGIYQCGNVVALEWRARLEEQLGSVSCELETPVAAMCLRNKEALAVLNAACCLTEAVLQERDPHAELYDALWAVCASLVRGIGFWEAYCRYELVVLRDCGFRLELEECTVTGEAHVRYVSPKTGKGVSEEGAGGYKDRLLMLPTFLAQQDGMAFGVPIATEVGVAKEDIAAALKLTGHFLHHWLFSSLGKPLPETRQRLESHAFEAARNAECAA